MTPPLPLRLHSAEIRMAGNYVSVSVHGLTVRTSLQPTMAAAMWAQLGAAPGQVSVTVRGTSAGAELIRIGQERFGMRVWIGPMSFQTPVLTRYWEALRSQEIAALERRIENVA